MEFNEVESISMTLFLKRENQRFHQLPRYSRLRVTHIFCVQGVFPSLTTECFIYMCEKFSDLQPTLHNQPFI